MDRRRFFQLGKKLVVYIPPIKLYLKTIRTCFANHVRHFGSIKKYKKNYVATFFNSRKRNLPKNPPIWPSPPLHFKYKSCHTSPGFSISRARAGCGIPWGAPMCYRCGRTMCGTQSAWCIRRWYAQQDFTTLQENVYKFGLLMSADTFKHFCVCLVGVYVHSFPPWTMTHGPR